MNRNVNAGQKTRLGRVSWYVYSPRSLSPAKDVMQTMSVEDFASGRKQPELQHRRVLQHEVISVGAEHAHERLPALVDPGGRASVVVDVARTSLGRAPHSDGSDAVPAVVWAELFRTQGVGPAGADEAPSDPTFSAPLVDGVLIPGAWASSKSSAKIRRLRSRAVRLLTVLVVLGLGAVRRWFHVVERVLWST